MRVSRETLKLLVIQHYEKDNDPSSEWKIIILPCRTAKAVKDFEEYYRKKFPPTQLISVNVMDSSIYG